MDSLIKIKEYQVHLISEGVELFALYIPFLTFSSCPDNKFTGIVLKLGIRWVIPYLELWGSYLGLVR